MYKNLYFVVVFLITGCITPVKINHPKTLEISEWRNEALRQMGKELHTLSCFDTTKYIVEDTKDYRFVQQIPIAADFALIQPLLTNVSVHSKILMTHSLMHFGYNQNPSIRTSLFIVDKGKIRLYHIDSLSTTSRGLKENLESKKQKRIYYEYESKKMLKTPSFCEDANYIYTLLTKQGKISKIRAFVGY